MVKFVQNLFEAGGFIMYPMFVISITLWVLLGLRIKRLYQDYQLEQMNVAHYSSDQLKVFASKAKIELKSYKTAIATLVGIAPLMGLLGTVIGMIETFESLGNMGLFTQSGGIAGGISQALLTTQMGLVIAIPGLFVGRVLNRKENKIWTQLMGLKNLKNSGEGEAF